MSGKNAIELSGLSENVKVYLETNSIGQILRDKGLDANGDVQRFHTQNVLRRIVKYMPYRTGATIKVTIAQTDISKPYIVTDVPYGKYLYYGRVMTGSPPKEATERKLTYTQTKNKKAGAFWDRQLVANEKDVLVREVQNYINRKGGKT